MNRGVKLLESDEQKHELSFLNLRAGERGRSLCFVSQIFFILPDPPCSHPSTAESYAAFHTASKYLISGLSLLEQDAWEKHYSLTLRLYDAASEALYVTGDFSILTSLVEKPLQLARCFDDKLNIYNYLVRSFAAAGQIEEGVATCLQVLAQLGEVIPSTITPGILHTETVRIKTILQGIRNDQLLSLPVITDTQKMVSGTACEMPVFIYN
jgi:predicted ATPase